MIIILLCRVLDSAKRLANVPLLLGYDTSYSFAILN